MDWIADALRRRGIQYGVEQDRIAALCQAPPPAPDTFTCLLASGTSPENGADTRVEYAFEHQKKGGTIRPDGSIDLRERNAALTVEETSSWAKL